MSTNFEEPQEYEKNRNTLGVLLKWLQIIGTVLKYFLS